MIRSHRSGCAPRGLANALFLVLLATATCAVLFRSSFPPSAAASSASCASVSCETRIVFDSEAGGIQHPPPCVNHGCAAGCYGGLSGQGGGWQTCKCAGQVEPRCCHLLYKPAGEGYDVLEGGGCRTSGDEGDPFASCPAGVCSIDVFVVIDPPYYEMYATCGNWRGGESASQRMDGSFHCDIGSRASA